MGNRPPVPSSSQFVALFLSRIRSRNVSTARLKRDKTREVQPKARVSKRFRRTSRKMADHVARKRPPRMDEASLKAMKAGYVKQKADEALKKGNYREAWTKYTECLELSVEREGRDKLLSNRSMAYCKARRFEEALRDAEDCTGMAPRWEKGWWRMAQALFGLKRYDEAIDAYKRCLDINAENKEADKSMWDAVLHLTTEQVAEGIVRMIERSQEEGKMKMPTIEDVTFPEKVEGMFRHIKLMSKDMDDRKLYFRKYMEWKKAGGWKAAAGYTERGAMYAGAKCYLQAREDGMLAVKLLQKQKGEFSQQARVIDEELAYAYSVVGEGYAAEAEHPDRDLKEATKAYTMAVDLSPACERYKSRLQEYGRPLTDAQITELLREVYNLSSVDLPPSFLEEHGNSKGASSRKFCVRVSVVFTASSPAHVTAKMRTGMLSQLTETLQVSRTDVIFDGMKVLPRKGLRVNFTINVHGDIVLGNEVKQQMERDAYSCLGGSAMFDGTGVGVDQDDVQVELVDITPLVESKNDAGSDGDATEEGESNERSIVVPSRPKLELEMPYKLYKLVTSDGRPVERKEKRAFQMSRVYYNSSEKPEEVWVEICDGSCRWRQSSSEVKLIVLKVPQNLSPKDLHVEFKTRYLHVKHKHTGDVYLEGQLERSVVPQECFWTYLGGDGEDGLMIFLRKMNLELLQKYWEHSKSWWPRLFSHHSPIEWDDYEKDYSDLPEVVAIHHRRTEAIQDAERKQEQLENKKVESRKERNELRKRTRQERLNVLRTGLFKSWVQLERENPKIDPLASSRPSDVDKFGH